MRRNGPSAHAGEGNICGAARNGRRFHLAFVVEGLSVLGGGGGEAGAVWDHVHRQLPAGALAASAMA